MDALDVNSFANDRRHVLSLAEVKLKAQMLSRCMRGRPRMSLLGEYTVQGHLPTQKADLLATMDNPIVEDGPYDRVPPIPKFAK